MERDGPVSRWNVMVLFFVRIVIEGGPPSNLEERSWVSSDSAINASSRAIRTARHIAP